jgi:hypothetical protein
VIVVLRKRSENMIVIKHGCKPEPKRWKFKCWWCGCEWIADETEVVRLYNYEDVCTRNVIYNHAVCCCPDCGHNVGDDRGVDADEYEKIFNKVEIPVFKITKEELH